MWLRTADWRIESGPEVNSYSSSWEISYSVSSERGFARSSVIFASDILVCGMGGLGRLWVVCGALWWWRGC